MKIELTLVEWATIIQRTENDDFYSGDPIAKDAVDNMLHQLKTDRKTLSDLLYDFRNRDDE